MLCTCGSKAKAHKSGMCSECRKDGFRERSLGVWDDPAFKENWNQSCTFSPRSALNEHVASLLTRLGVEFVEEHRIGPWSFDTFIPAHKLLIECQGEYWHTLSRRQRADRAKATYVEQYTDLRLLEVWEVEFYKEGRLEYLVRKALGLVTEQREVDFKALQVRKVERRDVSPLYGTSHYLGSCRGRWHFGLFLQDELIGACSFGPFQRNEQTLKYADAIELTRFCIDPCYQVKNISSWFLSRCLKQVGGTVVTYADRTQGHDGALYKATNFKASHQVPSDYYYVDSDGWVLHKKTVWNRSVSMKMSETDYAAKHSLNKCWGAEKSCFIYESGLPREGLTGSIAEPRKVVVEEPAGKVAQPVMDVPLLQQLKRDGASASQLAARFGVTRSMIFHTMKLRLLNCQKHGQLWSKKDTCPKCRAIAGSKKGGVWVKEAMASVTGLTSNV